MNILLLGSGGREHALAWKISQSKHCTQLYIAPGNGGTDQHGINVNLNLDDFVSVGHFCIENKINMIVVGPEDPLVKGIYDYVKSNDSLKHIIVVGPSKDAAQLEGSKAFSKKFMQRHHIPTAAYKEFTKENYGEGKAYLLQHSLPIVLKADGLAAGKGVVICQTHDEALSVFEEMIINKQFGNASSKVVVEQFLEGIEISVFVLTNGKQYKIIGHAKDYKRIGEGDTGPNTGGMGCVSPVPFADEIFMGKVVKRIIEPTISGLNKENLIYNGFIFLGLIKVNGDPYVIEYNCRMGDPETEVVIPRLKNDLVELFIKMDEEKLEPCNIEFELKTAITIMAVSGGYPGSYPKGKAIELNYINKNNNIIIFHAGTKKDQNGQLVTNGGRVLAVTSLQDSTALAAQEAKMAIEQVQFEGKYYRKDIGHEFI